MTSSMLIHPGEMIKDEIVARGLTQKDLAQQMVSQSSCDFRINYPSHNFSKNA